MLDDKKKKRKFDPVAFYGTWKGKITTWVLLFLLLFVGLFAYAFIEVYNSSNHFADFKTEGDTPDNTGVDSDRAPNLSSMLNELTENNYKYEYLITANDVTYKYSGVKKDLKDKGSLVFKDMVVNYYLESTDRYIKTDSEYLLNNDYPLYDVIDVGLLDIKNLKKIVDESEEISTTNFKNNLKELNKELVFNDFVDLYSEFGHLAKPNTIMVPDNNISLKVKYDDSEVKGLVLDLTSFYSFYKKTIYQTYTLDIAITNIGLITEEEVRK